MSGPMLAGIAFALLVVSTGLWARAVRAVHVPDNRGAYVAGFGAATALAVLSLVVGLHGLAYVPAVLSIIGGGFFLLTWAVSAQQVAADAITVGETLRPFTALDEHGEPFSSASLAGHPVLIKFFRGHW